MKNNNVQTPLLVTLLFLGGAVLSANELRIDSADELLSFSNNVNKGMNYNVTTVYLGSGIVFDSSLSQQFQPIGKTSSYSFQGTFDGQGHVIRNLVFNPTKGYVGLFGYSKRIIKNVIMDESCSFISSYNSSYANVGSIVGYCELCTVETVVSMGSVTYNGNDIIYLGGIVGKLLESSIVRNCVNYGPVTYSGNSEK